MASSASHTVMHRMDCLMRGAPWFRVPRFVHALAFRRTLGYWPQFSAPRTFNEKIWWTKFNVRDERLPHLVDKLAVRNYVRQMTPDLQIPKVIFVARRPEEIPFERLPDRCVIKSNHGSRHIQFVKRGVSDERAVAAECARWLCARYGAALSEWAYSQVQPCIFGEELLLDEEGAVPRDYKVFVFNGTPEFIQVDLDRFVHHTRVFYDVQWQLLNVSYGFPRGRPVAPPSNRDTMLQVASRLGSDLPFVRVDLYEVDGRLVFGELTFYPGSGMERFNPACWDSRLGKMLELSVWARQGGDAPNAGRR